MTRGTTLRALAATAVAVVAATACQPLPPLAVNTGANGSDHTPGDGVCEVTPGEGDCSLQAAVEEANALGAGTITVPPGTYGGVDLAVTGHVRINWDAPAAVLLDGVEVTVAAGGKLEASGLRAYAGTPGFDDDLAASYVVHGELTLRQSEVAAIDADTFDGIGIDVADGGSAAVFDSTVFGGRHAVRNQGVFLASRSSLFNVGDGRLVTEGDGVSHLQGTLLSRIVNTATITTSCLGTPPVSHGYNFAWRLPAFSGACGLTGPTDHTDTVYLDPWSAPGAGFVGVDAIPVGEAGCVEGTVDVFGNPRGVDGNGDGIGGCDIGAIERQP